MIHTYRYVFFLNLAEDYIEISNEPNLNVPVVTHSKPR